MSYVWACLCGHQEPCEASDQRYGAVYQCVACKDVYACVYPKGGGKAWIKVAPDDVTFNGLLDEPEFS